MLCVHHGKARLQGWLVPKMTTKMKDLVFEHGPGDLRGYPQVTILVAVIQQSGSFIH